MQDEKGQEILTVPLPENWFGIRYIHSVAQTPVTDYFRAEPPDIILDRTEFRDFGAGLPHNPGPGQRMITADGKIVITGYERHMPKFDLRVGRVAGHELLVPQARDILEIPLAEIAQPGHAITLSVRQPEQARMAPGN